MRWKRLIKVAIFLLIVSVLTGVFFWLRSDFHWPRKTSLDSPPKVALAAIAGMPFYLVDQGGVVLSASDSPPPYHPLIFLKGKVDLAVGQRYSPPEILFLLKLIREMKMRLLEPKMAKFQPPHCFLFWLADNTQVIFTDLKNINDQLDSLQLILARSKMEGRSVERVDLQYNKPVISQ